jgi:UDP-N-acetylglucosamine 2-epimerase (non-hydrolysing)
VSGFRVLAVFGTRPEAIKLAPVILKLRETPGVACRTCATAQHRHMLDQVLDLFGIVPDHDLDVMAPNQTLEALTARVLTGMARVIAEDKPDFVLVQGDTTTCFAAALAAFYAGVPVAHVEAGLRTGDLSAPFPEEANRVLVSRIAAYHFAPTARARDNLFAESIPAGGVWVTGNTVVDALFAVRERVRALPADHWPQVLGPGLTANWQAAEKRILITGHRRENFGAGFEDLCQAIRTLAERHRDWQFLYPVHLNPNVQQPVRRILEGLKNVALTEPQDYLPFVWLMDTADVILTDSGGVQEEAPSLGKPVLVMRDVTERPEAVEAGTVRLVGTGRGRIIDGVESVLLDDAVYARMARAHNPYGDGHAAERIVTELVAIFGDDSRVSGPASASNA